MPEKQHPEEFPDPGEQCEVIIYQTENGLTRIDVKVAVDTVWLTQQQMVELFQSSKSNVSEHIKNIFDEGELEEMSVVRKFRTTAADGKTYNMTFYSLDMIISLGYRIKSAIATRFRRWATERLKEYMDFLKYLRCGFPAGSIAHGVVIQSSSLSHESIFIHLHGVFTALSSSWTIWRVLMPFASASKLRMSRCARTAGAMA